jgi:hypothetical protein
MARAQRTGAVADLRDRRAIESARRGYRCLLRFSGVQMIKTWMAAATAVVLVGISCSAAQAQVFTPTFMSPQRSSDTGIYLNGGPGDFSVEGIWRLNLGTYDLGLRGGVADRRGAVFLVGAEFRSPLQLQDVPVSLALTGGVQAAVGDGSAAGFQAGLTVGYPVAGAAFTVVPYIHPRIALVSDFGRDQLELDPLADIGLDFVLPQNLVIRIGFGLGSPTASWGMGFAWR